jgi:preprotein translocase subunit SecE
MTLSHEPAQASRLRALEIEMANAVADNIGEARENVTGWWNKSRTFLTEVRNELKRVTWPSQKEVYATTVMVILTSAFFGVFLWLVDLSLTAAVNWVFHRFGGA